MTKFRAFAAVAALACAWSTPALAVEPGQSLVSIYRISSGQQVDFLKWAAKQDDIAVAAGIPKAQLFVHTSGDSWDYMMIFPVTTKADDDRVDAAAAKMGMNPHHMGLDMRKYVGSHTDTTTRGPTTAAEYQAWAGEK